MNAASNASARFQNHDRRARLLKPPGRRESRKAGTHDNNINRRSKSACTGLLMRLRQRELGRKRRRGG